MSDKIRACLKQSLDKVNDEKVELRSIAYFIVGVLSEIGFESSPALDELYSFCLVLELQAVSEPKQTTSSRKATEGDDSASSSGNGLTHPERLAHTQRRNAIMPR
jgi:hypothetical protein